MDTPELLKNIAFAQPLDLASLVDYAEGQVVSRTLAQNNALSVTLFAFDAGEGISAHTVPADAMVHILDGRARITIGDQDIVAETGQVVVMPEGVPHALQAEERFKMLLLVVKRPLTLDL